MIKTIGTGRYRCCVMGVLAVLLLQYSVLAASKKISQPLVADGQAELTCQTPWVPLYGDIKPLKAGDTLYVFSKAKQRAKDNELIAVQTLQGVLARNDGPRIWVDAGDKTFVDYFSRACGIRFDRRYAHDFSGLLAAFRQNTSGRYVLFDMDDRPSISAATTMAGLLDAVAIDVRLEPAVRTLGYEPALDVRGKDCRWVYEHYRDQLSNNAVIVHTNDYQDHPSVAYLRDFGPALKALDWWYDDEAYSRKVYQSIAPCSPVYGWQDPITSDEGLSVKLHSEEGLFQIPSDWMLNLSVHAAMGPVLKDKTFKQKIPRQKPHTQEHVHYVTFIMSDMDNILTEIGTNSFYSVKKYYANAHRGQFPMSWGMAPSLVELSPAAVQMWYDNATVNDAFVGYCGLGYFYPSVAPFMQTHARQLSVFLERADLKTLLLIDRVLPDHELTEAYYREKISPFTAIDQLRGLFYMDYIEYAPHGGKIFWFDGKPMVTARFDFRSEAFYSAVRQTPDALARSINAMPKDPTVPEGYSFVTVHAWSKGMDDIYQTIQLLDPDVKVVHAEEFIELIRLNLSKTSAGM